jgi:hypothetical protein
MRLPADARGVAFDPWPKTSIKSMVAAGMDAAGMDAAGMDAAGMDAAGIEPNHGPARYDTRTLKPVSGGYAR